MPPFVGTDRDKDALAAYIHSLNRPGEYALNSKGAAQ